MTGGRLKAVRRYLDEDEPFCFTYGDGLASVDIGALVAFHKAHREARHDHVGGAAGAVRRARIRR